MTDLRVRKERLAQAIGEKRRREAEANRLPWERPMDPRNLLHPANRRSEPRPPRVCWCPCNPLECKGYERVCPEGTEFRPGTADSDINAALFGVVKCRWSAMVAAGWIQPEAS